MSEETVTTVDKPTKTSNTSLISKNSNKNDLKLSIISKTADEDKKSVGKDRQSVEDQREETEVAEDQTSLKSVISNISIEQKKAVSIDVNYFDEKHVESTKMVFQDKRPIPENYGSVISHAFLDTNSLQAVHKKVNFAGRQDVTDRSEIQEQEVYNQEFEHGESGNYYSKIAIVAGNKTVGTSYFREDFPSVSITRIKISDDNQVKMKRKKKNMSRQQHKSIVSYTMGYRFAKRFQGSKTSNVSERFFNLGDTPNVIETLESISSEVEEEVEEEEEEEEASTVSIESASRSFFCDKHRTLSREIKQTQILNGILQKKLAVYFRQKNMRHVFKEDDIGINMSSKYNSLLDKYEVTSLYDKYERNKIAHQLEMMKKKKDTMKITLEQLFVNLQEREREVGRGLIHSKTGNEIPERYIDHLLSRQRSVKKNICEMRLTWLQLKTKVEEKEEAIMAIDKIDETHSLTGYEKLKAENFMLLDKLEEKEEDLSKVRISSEKTIQIVAQLREKISAFTADTSDLQEDSNKVYSSFASSRSLLTNLKIERDYFRREIVKMKENSGLLIYSDLLKDMEKCMEEVEQLQKQLKSLQTEYKVKSEQLRILRSKIEKQRVGRSGTKTEVKRESDKYKRRISVAKIFQRTPSTFDMKIPSGTLDFIQTDFAPKVTGIRFDDGQESSENSDN